MGIDDGKGLEVMPGWDRPMPWDTNKAKPVPYDPVEGDLGYEQDTWEEATVGELIGPERLAELRAEREREIEVGKLRHPSNRGRGIDGLIDDVRRLNEDQARQILQEEECEAERQAETGGEDAHLEMAYEDRYEVTEGPGDGYDEW